MKTSVWAKAKIAMLFFGLIFVFAQIFSVELQAQKRRKTPAARGAAKKKLPARKRAAAAQLNLPKVTQIDTLALGNLLKRRGENPKPLLINFWATWCEPCREEFPDLVKIDADYKGKIDFITISLDYLSEINGDVPKFLAQMKAEMPAYLLKTENESEAIALVSREWQGGLPFTILFDASGKEVYTRQGKIKLETVRAEIDKMVVPIVENKNNAKISFGTYDLNAASDKIFFNRKPIDDFAAKLKDAISKNELNIDAPFVVEVVAELDESGRLTKPVTTVKAGSDEKMSRFASEFILAVSDSQILKPLREFGSRQIRFMLAQDENDLKAIIQGDTDSENRAAMLASGLNMMLKLSKQKDGSDEAFLSSKTQASRAGKSFVINFSMSHNEKNQLIERNLKNRREK